MVPPSVVAADTTYSCPSRESREIWLSGLVVSVVITLTYHLPANIRIWTGDLTSAEATTELHRWLALHAVRTLAGLVAVVASYRAIAAAGDIPIDATVLPAGDRR